MRGNLPGRSSRAVPSRSIPAGAGEPGIGRCPSPGSWVYPRGCGGTPGRGPRRGPLHGLSPRVRGNLGAGRHRAVRHGSIPAGAGEPCSSPGAAGRSWVYPRGCGGTASSGIVPSTILGLSPRVRGNQDVNGDPGPAVGSIPAGAGEPASASCGRVAARVYPRGCGGTALPNPHGPPESGLSPRVRGNRRGPLAAPVASGSIPAGAGEPRRSASGGTTPRVYPRGCGGTSLSDETTSRPTGLSPRVRGNPQSTSLTTTSGGSIPAGAGEPVRGRIRAWRNWVYPRGCGGTGLDRDDAGHPGGLSPRVRGNLRTDRRGHRGPRSIPAGAGEPYHEIGARRQGGVYPRGCGGTRAVLSARHLAAGLSPRVRGNLPGRPASARRAGSIPAGAGEPRCAGGTTPAPGVYPRGCGGTRLLLFLRRGGAGLSPRVRGNLQHTLSAIRR